MLTFPRSKDGRRGWCVWATGKGAMDIDVIEPTPYLSVQRPHSARCSALTQHISLRT